MATDMEQTLIQRNCDNNCTIVITNPNHTDLPLNEQANEIISELPQTRKKQSVIGIVAAIILMFIFQIVLVISTGKADEKLNLFAAMLTSNDTLN